MATISADIASGWVRRHSSTRLEAPLTAAVTTRGPVTPLESSDSVTDTAQDRRGQRDVERPRRASRRPSSGNRARTA